jgi:hypothetical protein
MENHKTHEWDLVHLSNYESKAFWYIHWLYSALDLIESAKLLVPKIQEVWENLREHSSNQNIALIPNYYTGPYFMLMGFATENILKAGLVLRNESELRFDFQQTRRFPKLLEGHDLVKLAKKMNFQTGTDEEDLLRRLSRNTVWAGRYPIPIDFRKIKPTEIFTDGEERLITWNSKQDALRIENLITRMRFEFGLMNTEQ